MKKIILFLSVIAFILSGCGSAKTDITDYVVAIGEDPERALHITDVGVLVIDADYYSSEEIEALRRNNVREIYSYLNIGSIEAFRDYYDEFESYTLGAYENWPDERWIDVSSPEWQEFLTGKIKELSEKGIDGFFVDNTDVYYLYPTDEIYQGIVHILSDINAVNKKVIINGGDYFVKTYLPSENCDKSLFHGINQESVYTKYDFSSGEYTKNTEEEIRYYTEYLDVLLHNGIQVYVLEYATDPGITEEAYAFARERNYTCYVSNSISLTF